MISDYKLKIYDRILATISALAIIGGGIWTVTTYLNQQKEQTKQLERQVRWEIYNQKSPIYYELCDAEAEIAACDTHEEVLLAQKNFWRLYYGKAHIIAQLEDTIFKQKIRFMKSLNNYLWNDSNKSPNDVFGSSSLELSLLCSHILDIDSLEK
jgi:hypothetical protein